MSKGLVKLKQGKFNVINQEPQADGSVIVTLYSRKEDRTWRFRVRNLYSENEQEVDIDTGKPIAKGSL